MLRIGKTQNGLDVYISEQSPNRHISILGISGSGKTVRLKEMIQNAVLNGDTVLVFDINGSDYKDCADKMNIISVKKDGLNIDLLNRGRESNVSNIMDIVHVLTEKFRLGSRQEIALRTAVLDAANNIDENENDLLVIRAELMNQKTSFADIVENRMQEFFEMNIVKKNSSQRLKSGYANVISFEGLSKTLQRIWIELILTVLWQKLREDSIYLGTLWIFIDEFQNLSLKEGAVLLEMLRESRKYGVNIVLATQSVSGYGKEVMAAIDQTAIHLYFQQGLTDVKRVSSLIDVKRKGVWEDKLRNLRIGESIVLGKLWINGRIINNPLIIKSEYKGT